MHIEGSYTEMAGGDVAGTTYENAAAYIEDGPKIFAPGIFISTIRFYADNSKEMVIFEDSNLVSEDNSEKTALLSGINVWAQEMILVDD
ncbi:hypothetical protein [Gibbsiella quercinecans]|uniref:hypothetical protein n=1 Tax=Gibbsiella quercinecans TaxID=929813 RepID=UPI00242C5AE0|nr:hypothetical protein [Gibbsiella quercinecans]